MGWTLSYPRFTGEGTEVEGTFLGTLTPLHRGSLASTSGSLPPSCSLHHGAISCRRTFPLSPQLTPQHLSISISEDRPVSRPLPLCCPASASPASPLSETACLCPFSPRGPLGVPQLLLLASSCSGPLSSVPLVSSASAARLGFLHLCASISSKISASRTLQSCHSGPPSACSACPRLLA